MFFLKEFEGEMKGFKYNREGRELEALFQVCKRKKKTSQEAHLARWYRYRLVWYQYHYGTASI